MKNIAKFTRQFGKKWEKNRDSPYKMGTVPISSPINSYLRAAKEFPKEFKIIECLKNGKFLPPEIIHQKIWKIVKKNL